MGQLVDGTWHGGDLPTSARGAFVRAPTTFRGRELVPEAGRYHLYASYACPWAHRVLITRALRGLTGAIGLTIVDPHMGEQGWPLRADDPDPIGGASYLYEVYLRADPRYTGRATVPVLWDRVAGTIVNNESRELMRLLDRDLAPLAREPVVDTLFPDLLVPRIEETLDAIYQPINNGVYRAGLATDQAVHEAAVREVFAALARWDEVLGRQRYTCGDTLTAADVALFTTLLRFDPVYHFHFKCNLRRLRDHANLWRFTRELWTHPAIAPTCHLDHIKAHYYWSHTQLNPTRIIPLGPILDEA
ncbi:MAG TPA: glutathione S-transferase C-terminal domain-containing protein [Kofleriaceae bacterium]|nr:glutathione S-transferase C-terminal domain-containing protein [Kofleriaceae bacterium]